MTRRPSRTSCRRFTDRAPVQPRTRAHGGASGALLRIVMVGDWGSGVPRARLVASQMRKHIDDALVEGVAVHVVHLGDVYDSGVAGGSIASASSPTGPSSRTRRRPSDRGASNANHDMYSGGYGYFDHMLQDPRFAKHGGSSWFVFENDDWRFIGLDTAWDETGLHDERTERGLADPQAASVAALAEDGRPLVLFSHHPLFSAFHGPDQFLRVTASDLSSIVARSEPGSGVTSTAPSPTSPSATWSTDGASGSAACRCGRSRIQDPDPARPGILWRGNAASTAACSRSSATSASLWPTWTGPR